MNTRREFLFSIPLLLIACTKNRPSDEEIKRLGKESDQNPDNGKNLVSEKNPIASTFQYVKDATTASAMMRKDRMGTAAGNQFCNNCQYYAAIGDDYGSCQMIPQGNVKAKGWCISWAKKVAMPDDVNKSYEDRVQNQMEQQ